jgi:cardiolipin synthase
MLDQLKKPPNLLTAIRFVSIPVLWVFALKGRSEVLGIGLLLGGLTDVLDGYAARRANHVAALGSKFDSIADHSLQLSAVAWLFMLMPEVFSENAALTVSALTMNLFSLLVGIVKFRRIANLHLYLSKAGYFLFLLFMMHAFLVGQYSWGLLILACSSVILASAETLSLQLMRDRVDEDMGSLLFLYLDEEHPLRRVLRGNSQRS